MQFSRRYLHLTLVICAYVFLLVVTRWAFLSQVMMAVIEDDEASILRTRHIHTGNPAKDISLHEKQANNAFQVSSHGNIEDLRQHNLEQDLKFEKHSRVARRAKEHVLQAIFSNFLHP
ncbi:hypothetical protein DPMN_108437 [Dreissena polymorpha]|uniref:Uncharacterized protein n=1 Tax=Dreissena polymorpha TaxID=45954 RepID=A0A9D4QM25_DREPO|nr:hypothetical protein DPMN_108437 [Dreissena polymorpha]